MSVAFSTYYNLIKTRELGPEAKDWAVTDKNFELLGLILKAFEQHAHTGAVGIVKPTAQPILTEVTTGGSLAPGTTVGVRLSYTNTQNLETDATVEQDITLVPAADRAIAPTLSSVDPAASGLTGGTYMYVITKVKAAGETEASDVLPVNVAYDQPYSITIGFYALSTYTDGTVQYNIYRSAGLDSSFQLVGQITDTSEVTFTDDNVSIDQTQQPPSVSTFDMTRSVTIDWTALTYPAGATKLNVYVTQQPGVWATQHLLTSIDLTAPTPPDGITYLGSETLSVGYPYETSQIPSQPPKVNLATEATGGFVLTADGDFQGHQAKNVVFDTRSGAPGSPANGQIYYDTSLNNIRAYINGSWTNWGISAGSAYTHPVEEVGGHLSTNIRWVAGSATPNLNSLLTGKYFDSTGKSLSRGTVTTFTLPGSQIQTTSTSTTVAWQSSDMSLPSDYNGNAVTYMVTVCGSILVSGPAGNAGYVFVDGYQLPTSYLGGSNWNQYGLTATALGQSFPLSLTWVVQISGTAQWHARVVWATYSTSNGLTFQANTFNVQIVQLA